MIRRPTEDAPLFIRPVDPNIRPQDVEDIKTQNARMLARLLKGPATRSELEAIGCGTRVAARRVDLNEHFEETGDPRRIKGRWLTGKVYEYRIVGGAA